MSDTTAQPGAAQAAPASTAAPQPGTSAAPAPAQGQPPVEQAPKEVPQVGKPDPVDEALPASKQGEVFAYDPTGNDMLDYALTWVGNLGFGPDHPAIKAAGQNNWSLLEAEIARLGSKAVGGDKIIALAQKAITDEQGKADKAAAETRALCIKTFGGSEEQFDGMMKWMTEQANAGNITQEERADLNRMLARGGFQATLAIQSIAGVYAKAKGNVVTPAATAGETGASTGTENTKWSSKTWAAYNREMRAKHGPSFERHPDYQRARAQAAAQAGLTR